MLCARPYTGAVVPVGCGRCLPCRINKRRTWAHRLVLESYLHPASIFLTLTYSDDFLPNKSSLVPLEPQLWLKRYRRAIFPRLIRFFLVGEYGTQTQRPHYHAAIFNASRLDQTVIEETWTDVDTRLPLGHVHIGDLNSYSAGYLCGYVTKNMTNPDNPLLEGRHPEFARQSNRPGIGADAMQIVADAIFKNKHLVDELDKTGDVPSTLTHGRKPEPLGQYLKQRLRNLIGMPDEFRQEKTWLYSVEMSAVLQAAIADPKNKALGLSQILADESAQKRLQITTNTKIHEKDRPL